MKITLLSIFPNLIKPYFQDSIMKRAIAAGLIDVRMIDIRDFSPDKKHHKVDDHPYGGGPGMLMMAEPILAALRATRNAKSEMQNAKSRVILLDARGPRFTQKKAQELSQYGELIFICGRYEGVDERVVPFVDEQISIGDFVVTGGELPAMMVADAVVRLLPGVLGDDVSSEDESHSQEGVVEYPQYTRPEKLSVNGQMFSVPDVLLSGDHAKIEKWRAEQKKRK